MKLRGRAPGQFCVDRRQVGRYQISLRDSPIGLIVFSKKSLNNDHLAYKITSPSEYFKMLKRPCEVEGRLRVKVVRLS
jgi:hypothetical protein